MTFTSEQAMDLATIRVRCPWCDGRYRPCNLRRHIERVHHRQLTIYDMLDLVEAERKT